VALLLVHPAQAEQSFGACSRIEPVRQAGMRKVGGCGGAHANKRTYFRLQPSASPGAKAEFSYIRSLTGVIGIVGLAGRDLWSAINSRVTDQRL
jgi:hypothetical protein